VYHVQSDTFERVQQNKDASGLHNRAKLILEIESFMRYASGDTSTSNFVKALRVLLSMRIPYHHAPRFLHVLKPKSAAGQGDEWQGRMRVMFKKFDDIDTAQRETQARIDAAQRETQARNDAGQKDTQTRIEALIDAAQNETHARIEQLEAQHAKFQQDISATLHAILAASQMRDGERTMAEEQRRTQVVEERDHLEPEEEARLRADEDEPQPQPEVEVEAETEAEPELYLKLESKPEPEPEPEPEREPEPKP
jgi:hypothetical protein